jgi:hypothetical protein
VATRSDGTLDGDAFYGIAGELLGPDEIALARVSSTKVRVRRECLSLPTKRVARLEALPMN